MRCLVFLVLLCGLVASTSVLAQEVQQSHTATPAPRYIVNLDMPAKQRWQHIIGIYHERNAFAPIMNWVDNLVPKFIRDILIPIFADADKYLPRDYPDELRGVAEASHLSLGQIVFMNLIYDLTAFCTSIVAEAENGTIFHSRNLDYDLPGLRNITIQVEFQKDGKRLYECTTFAGYVGCLTGMRPGGFSVSVDERNEEGTGLLGNIIEALIGGNSIGMFLRGVLHDQSSFSDALPLISNTHLIAPVYIIVGGVSSGEGSVVTRNRTVPDNIWMINATAGRWWEVETNYDHWEPPPSNDDRRDPANKGMKAMGRQALSNDGLWKVLSTHPVLNHGTEYTAQMIPKQGYANAWVRYDAVSAPRRPRPKYTWDVALLKDAGLV